MGKSFAQKVYDIIAGIPRGKVMSYGVVARYAGSSRAARVVGTLMNKNPDLKRVPCHRVIKSDSHIGDYAYGTDEKIAKLRAEGVHIVGDIVDQDDIVQ